MKIISESDYSVNFNAKPKSSLLKRSKQIATAAVGGLTVFNLQKNKKDDTTTDDNKKELTAREALIKSKIEESIQNKQNISIKSIAKELNLPLHLVITSLYRTKSSIRNLFDKVKNTAYLRKPTSEANKEKAKNIINSSKNFLTTSSTSQAGDDYINNIGKKLDIFHFSPEEIKELTNLYQMKPALANLILFSRSKSPKAGFISPVTMKSIIAAHEINSELTEELIVEKKKSGQFYALRDIYKIVKVNQMSEKLFEPAKEDARLVYELATARMKNGKPRFGADDILQILKSMKEEPELTKSIIQEKDNYPDFKYNGHQVRQILSTYEKYPSIVNYLINARFSTTSDEPDNKYSSFCIEKVLDTLNGDDIDKIRMVKKLLNNKTSSSMILTAIEKYEAEHEKSFLMQSDYFSKL